MAALVHEFIESAVRRFGDRTALVDARGSLTFAEMWERSTRLASVLTDLGVRPGDRVVAVMNNRNEWMEIDGAVSMIGAVRSRLNGRDGDREYALVLQDTTPNVVITGPEFTARVQTLIDEGKAPRARVLGLGGSGDYESLIGAAEPCTPARFADDTHYLIYHTSGTTGRYKGACYDHRNFVAQYRNILATMLGEMGPDAAFLHLAPLSHQSGLFAVPVLFRGARSVMMEEFDPNAVFDAIEEHGITHTVLAPAMINMLANHPEARRRDLSSLRCVIYAGSPIAPSVLRNALEVFGPIFLQGYGSTEAGGAYQTFLYPEDHIEALKGKEARLSSCGRPSPFFDVKVADEAGKEVPVGEIGELCMRGDAVSTGYWNQPEATAEAYVDGWFRTGDLATRDEDDFITIVDRKNDTIISGGLNVYPREIEDVIAEHPLVDEVAVVGVPDDKWGEAVKACVSLRSDDQTMTLEELQEHCRKMGLASYKKPLSIDVVPEIPKTPVGKIFRRALREPYWGDRPRRVG